VGENPDSKGAAMKWLFLFLWWPLNLFADPFFGSHHEGWFWYQDFPLETKKLTQTVNPVPFNPTEAMSAFRQKVEDSLNLAVLFPTQENLKDYAKHYFDVIKRGQRFTDGYKLMLLNYPQYDYALNFPTNHLNQPVYARQQQNKIEAKIRQFCQSNGFFFFFSSRCPACHAFAPIVKQFKEKYSSLVTAISLDGGSVPEFPTVTPDNGMAAAFNLYRVPALYALNPKTQQAIAITHGMISLSQLEENILKILKVSHE